MSSVEVEDDEYWMAMNYSMEEIQLCRAQVAQMAIFDMVLDLTMSISFAVLVWVHFRLFGQFHRNFSVLFGAALFANFLANFTSLMNSIALMAGAIEESIPMIILFNLNLSLYFLVSAWNILAIAERAAATKFSSTYEDLVLPWPVHIVALVTAVTCCLLYGFMAQTSGDFDSYVLLGFSAFQFSSGSWLIYRNRSLLTSLVHRDMGLSERYQIGENMRALRAMLCFICFDAIVITLDFCAVPLFGIPYAYDMKFCMREGRLWGYIAIRAVSWLVELGTPIGILGFNRRYRQVFMFMLRCSSRAKHHHQQPVNEGMTMGKSVNGRKIITFENVLGQSVSSAHGLDDHFAALAAAWAIVPPPKPSAKGLRVMGFRNVIAGDAQAALKKF